MAELEHMSLINQPIQSLADFERLFHQYYGRLGRYAMRFLSNPEDARDLVQAVFVRLWEKKKYLDDDFQASAYLHTAVRNACLNHLEHMKVRQVHAQYELQAPLPRDHSPQDHLEAHETAERIRLALAELPDRCREAFLLSRREGLSYQEVAERMQISPKTVEVQIGKALKLLRTQLGAILPILLLIWRG